MDQVTLELALAHGGIERREIPARVQHVPETAQNLRPRSIRGKSLHFLRISLEIEQLILIDGRVDELSSPLTQHHHRRDGAFGGIFGDNHPRIVKRGEGSNPVMNAARDGAHRGLAQYAVLKATPSAYKRRRCGILRNGTGPFEKSVPVSWSTMTMRMVGPGSLLMLAAGCFRRRFAEMMCQRKRDAMLKGGAWHAVRERECDGSLPFISELIAVDGPELFDQARLAMEEDRVTIRVFRHSTDANSAATLCLRCQKARLAPTQILLDGSDAGRIARDFQNKGTQGAQFFADGRRICRKCRFDMFQDRLMPGLVRRIARVGLATGIGSDSLEIGLG